ncbi:hypothetical protein AUK11_02445 [bacterium CG2_30_37_16]|nr:MAG: hypothetical protein AUK11_02445 [bacterium CG2_30_37_16]PIP30269.1 MAG: hypothetical protein COX25_05595 [bacterium (Candidatus Howlettbacteria) CG23_combo_of_CG06-09_8_20_14_all_37_9]PIY00101.1 MAG: hypothetical protein COZ22_01145 [bacterium (Candidatus Howlettbacteria) CG_4_10_14_3_um_filter_37_10]PJB06562.1 MAG: hypothetical protein CO123_01950 [bacterium (Candidatus Howlettbacteria) CG_4_9_14_3_um_filter_37_10]
MEIRYLSKKTKLLITIIIIVIFSAFLISAVIIVKNALSKILNDSSVAQNEAIKFNLDDYALIKKKDIIENKE